MHFLDWLFAPAGAIWLTVGFHLGRWVTRTIDNHLKAQSQPT